MVSSVRKVILASTVACGLGLLVSAQAEATECDLINGTSCTINGALFATDEQHPTGTGFIDAFLRVQDANDATQTPNPKDTWEQGYNTSARPVQDSVQVKIDPNFTRDITLGEIGTKVINGVTYYEFFLDINEPSATAGSKNLITLDQLEIYVSNTASLNYYTGQEQNGSSGTLCKANSQNTGCKNNTTATKVYDLDGANCTKTDGTGCDNYVNLDYLISGQGSGSSDMVFYLAASAFAGYNSNSYVYLFSQFGDKYNVANKYESEAGFEEWFSHDTSLNNNTGPLNPVPEPASLLLVGSGLGLAARRWRQVRRAA